MHRGSSRRAFGALFVSVVIAAAFASEAGAATSAPSLQPFDYIALKNRLSQPKFPNTIRQSFNVPMHDGETLYVEVVRPDPKAYGAKRLPVILEASPYHGTLADRKGTRIFPDPKGPAGNLLGLTGYFAPRGYAVVMVDLRGTGRSTGCLEHGGPNDAKDLKTIVEWAASRSWSNGRVGMTGHSYVGSTPSIAAAQKPNGLVTIVPSAGLASFYDHQFNKGVPWLLQWAGPMFAYEMLAMDRDVPPVGSEPVGGGQTGDNWENAPNPEFGCGWQNSALTAGSGQVTGQYEAWHAARDWREGAAAAGIPIFMVHGVNDNAARIPAAEWFFGSRFMKPGDKVWIGQWDHGSTNGRCGSPATPSVRQSHPTCRFDQFKYALHAWFDKHLMQRNVPTGPAVEAFLNGPNPVNVTTVMDPQKVGGLVYATDGWKRPAATVGLFPDATAQGPAGSNAKKLSFQAPTEEGRASFATVANAVAAGVSQRAIFTSDPLSQDALFLGLPELRLNASVSTAEIAHLTATLFREKVTTNEQGQQVVSREPMNFCAIQPQLRNGVETVTPVVPLEEMALDLQCFTMAHWVPAGQRLSLEISTKTPHHASFGDTDAQITVYTGPDATAYSLPAVPSFMLYSDVPLYEPQASRRVGEAQPAITGTVTIPATNAGVKVEPLLGLSTAAFEFDSLKGFDNAKFETLATPTVAADLDLYLQQQTADGGWEDLTAATSSDLDKEVLNADRLLPGRYRIVVNNWSGGPQQVELKLTFFNGAGKAADGSGGTGTAVDGFVVTHETFGGLPQP